MEKYGPAVVAASWDSVIFDVPGKPALQRLPLLDPLKGTRAQVGSIIDASADVTELFDEPGRVSRAVRAASSGLQPISCPGRLSESRSLG